MTDRFRQRLLEDRERLVAEIELEKAQRRDENMGQFAGRVHNPDEEANAGAQAEVNHAVLTLHQGALRAIERALARIDAGTYGVCATCGETIDAGRLQAAPHSERCTRCQEDLERSQRP